MTQAYSDPSRENDPHALPDVEVFWGDPHGLDEHGEPILPGWYWWRCFPGCMPDTDAIGPFDTEAEALADARELAGE